MKTYDYINRVVIMLPLSVYEGTWTYSPLSLLCITMILCVCRNFFEITTFPNNRDTQDVICEEKPCKSVDMMTVTATLALA